MNDLAFDVAVHDLGDTTCESADPSSLAAWRCPVCHSGEVIVLDKRNHPTHVARRKKCEMCGHRFKTVETVIR